MSNLRPGSGLTGNRVSANDYHVQKSPADIEYEEYLKKIEPYQGTDFYDSFLNNPYLRKNNSPFSPTLWQQLAGVFGDTSAEDAYYQQLKSNSELYFADLVQLYDQTKYNDVSADVARTRSAGINTDLQGPAGSSAAENDQPKNVVGFPPDAHGQAFQQIGNLAMSFFSGVMEFANGIQSMHATRLANVGQEIQNNKDAMDFAIHTLANTGMFNNVDEFDNLSDEEFGNIVLNAASKFDFSKYSPKTRKVLKSAFDIYSKQGGKDKLGVAALKSQLRNVLSQNSFSAAKSSANPLFDEDFSKMLSKVGSIFSSYENDAYLASLKRSKAEDDYNSKYFNEASSRGLAAESVSTEIQGYQSERELKQSEETINHMWNEIYEAVKGDKWYNVIGIILVSYLRSLSLNPGSLHVSGPRSTTNVRNTDVVNHNSSQIMGNQNIIK